MRKVSILFVLIGMGAGGAAYYSKHMSAAPVTTFQTVAIKRGDLLSTIGATGTLEPEEVVDVGAQVAGLILEFGTDPHDPTKLIDYGSVVEKGTVLAKIDSTPYEAALEQAEATLERSEADLLQLVAKYEQTEQEWKRAASLRPMKAIADTDYDLAVANYRTAKANVAVGKAAIRQNKAALRMAKTNLGYTTITSPVRGVIIDRRVNIGQTVVAALNAPSLFLIAKDLRRMQVWASVNEADIGQVRVDMPVQFTVDAHPGKTFHGKVTQVRMNASTTQNVVTYTVVVTFDNSRAALLPYLTANAQFEVERRPNALQVPNAALRWKPRASNVVPSDKAAVASAFPTSQERGCLWIDAGGGRVRPLEVAVGISDGAMTEISGRSVEQGMQVVVGEEGREEIGGPPGEVTTDDEKPNSPFLPKPPKGAKPPPGPM